MNKDLKYFMRNNVEEIVKVPGPSTIVDEKGMPIELEIKVLGNLEIQGINNAYRKRTMATDKKGNPLISMGEVIWKTEKDSSKASRHIMVEALHYPNLKDKDLMEFYKCTDITDMPLHVFRTAEEYTFVSRAVMTALGLGNFVTDEEALEAAKN